jgi:hypothetical protein
LGQDLAEEALEEIRGQYVPSNSVGDGGEDPVELAHDGLAVVELPGNLVEQMRLDVDERRRPS